MSTSDKTIIYYTSNAENPKFEAKIRLNILKQKGDLAIISVSQKPIDFGRNICVGDVGLSYVNAWRQMLIGIKEATTPYVVLAESDFLYPQDYFNFEPNGASAYQYNNVWIVFTYKYRWFFRKAYSEGAQVAKRDYMIRCLEAYLAGQPEWFDGKLTIKRRGRIKKTPFDRLAQEFGDAPCVSFKTGRGVRWMTDVMRGKGNIVRKLPYWGHVEDVQREYETT